MRCERVRKFFGTGKLGCGTPPADIASAVSENARVLVFVEAAHIGFVLGTLLAECKIRAFEMQAEESGRSVLFLGGTVDIDGLKKLGEVSRGGRRQERRRSVACVRGGSLQKAVFFAVEKIRSAGTVRV